MYITLNVLIVSTVSIKIANGYSPPSEALYSNYRDNNHTRSPHSTQHTHVIVLYIN